MAGTSLLDRAAPAPAGRASADAPALPAIEFDHVSFAFDDNVVLRDVSFSVPRGAMKILLGASGAGKSIVLKLILGLYRPDSGTIVVNSHRISDMTEADLMGIRAGMGMLFQESALFDSLTVAENVGYRFYEETRLPLDQVRQRVLEVLSFVGLEEYIDRHPSELSGGQRRRVAIARAMAGNPDVLLFDEPTSGLDPITAVTVDDQIVKLRDLQHVTSVLVTHQIRDAFYIATHEAVREAGGVKILAASEATIARVGFIVLQDSRIAFEGSAGELLKSRAPYLRNFLYRTLPPW